MIKIQEALQCSCRLYYPRNAPYIFLVHQDSEVHVRYNQYSPYHFHKIAPYLGNPDCSVARVNKTETT